MRGAKDIRNKQHESHHWSPPCRQHAKPALWGMAVFVALIPVCLAEIAAHLPRLWQTWQACLKCPRKDLRQIIKQIGKLGTIDWNAYLYRFLPGLCLRLENRTCIFAFFLHLMLLAGWYTWSLKFLVWKRGLCCFVDDESGVGGWGVGGLMTFLVDCKRIWRCRLDDKPIILIELVLENDANVTSIRRNKMLPQLLQETQTSKKTMMLFSLIWPPMAAANACL